MSAPLSRESPNSRTNTIKRFLSQAPKTATRLRLLFAETPPMPLGEWAPGVMGDQSGILAEEIDQLMIDHASENPRYRQNFLLCWCAEDGSQLTVKPLSVYGHQLRGETPEDTVRDLDGTSMSQVAQSQRHLEAMMRLHLGWQGQIVQTMSLTIDRLSERCAQIETSNGSRHDELLEAKETILGLVTESQGDKLTEAQAKAFELMEKLAPMFMTWLQARTTQPPKAPPKSNGQEKPHVPRTEPAA